MTLHPNQKWPVPEANVTSEKDKYEYIYSHQDQYPTYGKGNHGKKFAKMIRANERVLDIGCGHQCFKRLVGELQPSATVVGVDIACPSADHVTEAWNLPYSQVTFDWVTAFDVLEHIREEDLDRTFIEFASVAYGFLFTISHRDSKNKVAGETLHPTVKSREWWRNYIENYGTISYEEVVSPTATFYMGSFQ